MIRKMQILWIALALIIILSQSSFTYAQGKYYLLGKEQLQFTLAADSEKEIKAPNEWQEMFAFDGKKYQVKKKPLIDSSDIEGISVESFTYASKEEYTITIYFKRESWDRISEATKSIVGKNLAVIRNHKLLSAPRVMDAIEASTAISGGVDSARLKTFLDGLTPASSPDKSARNKEYMSWIERRQASNKNDLALASKLAYLYLVDGTKDYAKAAQLFELILQKDPSRTDTYSNLGMCYAALGKTDKAIDMFTKAIAVQPENEWGIRSEMAELYFSRGEKQKAIEQMSIGLDLLKKSAMPGAEGVMKSLERRLQEMRAAK
jgi:tetratricopeptide (TPR) repeat protein